MRSEVTAGTRWGARAAVVMKLGDLVPSQAIQDLLAREIRNRKFPLVIEGYPRRLSEADSLPALCGHEAMLIYFLFDIRADAAVSRLAARLVCSRCGCAASRRKHSVCPRCSGPLASRDDDSSPNAIRRRLQNFERETVPLIEYYKSRGELEVIDALLEESSVYEELTSRIAGRCRLSVDPSAIL